MVEFSNAFARSIRRQITLNQARTPTERLDARCDLLDAVRAMAPGGPDAYQRRRRALAARQRDREQLRAECRRLFASRRPGGERLVPIAYDAAGNRINQRVEMIVTDQVMKDHTDK